MAPTKLRATSVVLAFLLPATLLMAMTPAGAAGVGDTLLNGTTAVAPGNPCAAAAGPSGGIAVREAGTSSILYYATRNQSQIRMTEALVAAGNPSTCLGAIIPAVTGTNGWEALAYDAAHPTVKLWAARNGTATIHGLALTGAVLRTIPLAPGTSVLDLAVDEASPNRLFVATGSSSLLVYDVTPVTPTLVGSVSFPHGVASVEAWGGALLTGDGGDWVRNAKPDGTWLGMLFHPGDTYIDPWWQPQRSYYHFESMAFDEQTYAGSGKGALWTARTEGGYFCIGQCAVYQCTQYEGPTCIAYQCVQWCGPNDAILGYSVYPVIRAFEVTRTCPGGVSVPPAQECVCQTATAPVFTSPTNAVLLRGVPASASAPPLVVQGTAIVTATGPSPQHVITLRGPLPGGAVAVGYQTASAAPLSSGANPRGAYTYEATLFDAAAGCRGGTSKITLWLEEPTSWTRAQALRIEGNIPLNLVAGSLGVEPQDDLFGAESARVVDRRDFGGLTYDLVAFDAYAAHAPVAGAERRLVADAHAVALDAVVEVDLARLCLDLTGQTACAALPTFAFDDEDLRAHAHAQAEMMTATGVPAANASTAFLGGILAVDPCAPVACDMSVGPFRVVFHDSWSRTAPLVAESYAAVMRIEVSEGPYRGEIVVSEAYAGVSLGGRALLQGPTGFLATQDDFGTGADAPAAGGPVLVPGAWSGQFAGLDRKDSFKVIANLGEKLRVAVDPAHRVGAHAAPLPTAPAAGVAPRLLRVTLLAPDATVRDVSHLGVLDAHPGFVELNVDQSGAWTVVVERIDTRDERAPYTVAIQTSAVILLAGDDAPSCFGATALNGAPVARSMGPADAADTFALTVAPGERVTLALKPDDAEGADFDLYVYDAACGFLAKSINGKEPRPKGEPEALAALVVPPGTVHVQVVRVNGIGNFVLEALAHRGP